MTQLLNAIPGALAQGLIWGVMAIGVYITYKVLDIADLTVDGSLCTGAAVCTMLLLAGHSPWIAMLCAVLAGLLAGTVTGLLHVLLGIPPILAGILTQMVLWSVNLKILGKANQALPARSIDVLLTQMNIPAALPVLLGWAAVLVTLLVLFFSTELGCALRATGCNPVMSRAQGVNTGLMKVIGLALSNAVVAMSGGLLCQYQGYTDVNMGRGAVVIGLAAGDTAPRYYRIREAEADGFWCGGEMYRVAVLPNGVDGAVRITVNGSVWDDGALTFVNRTARSLTVRKTVEGEMGDRSKAFPFTAVLTVDGQAVPFPAGEGYTVSGGQAVFALRHGESLTFTGLPYGGVVTVTETEHAGYTVTNSGRSGDSGAVTLGDGGELVFVNTKRAVPDLGVAGGTLLPAGALVCCCGGLLLWSRKRRA